MIYDYVNTKPPLEEVYMEHGWLKDQAAKVHKYIERWRGKNGKWYYRYKSKAQELGTKINRKTRMYYEPKNDEISWNHGREVGSGYVYDNGKASSTSGALGNRRWDKKPGLNSNRGVRVNAGLTAGRKRAAKKGYAVKGYRGKTRSNLSSRGYSRSNSPKATETLNLNGRKVSYDIYDQPSSFLNSPGYYRAKGKNDVFVSRGTNAGRKRAAKKKKK